MVGGGARRRARGYALQMLYWLDVNDEWPPADVVRRFYATFEIEDDPEATAFADELAGGTRARLGDLDGVVQTASRNWRIERMSRVDRNILRLATWELEATPEVPVRVVINEAVELAKRFGTAESPAFVNGILDRIAHTLGRA